MTGGWGRPDDASMHTTPTPNRASGSPDPHLAPVPRRAAPRRRMRRGLPAGLFACALVLAGCGGSDDDTSDTGSDGSTTSAAASEAPASDGGDDDAAARQAASRVPPQAFLPLWALI